MRERKDNVCSLDWESFFGAGVGCTAGRDHAFCGRRARGFQKELTTAAIRRAPARRAFAGFAGALVAVLVAGTAFAGSAGWLDSTYAHGGTAYLRPLPGDRRLDAVGIARSPRGVVVLMNAQFAPGGGSDEDGYYLAGLTSSGDVDPQWNGGRPALAGYVESGDAWAVLSRPVGPLVVGWANDAPGISRIVVTARKWDGTLQVGFAHFSTFFSAPVAMSSLGSGAAAILADGRIRICATVPSSDPTPGVYLLGLTSQGNADTSVGPDGMRKLDLGQAQSCNGLVADDAGRFIVAGTGRVAGRRAAIVGRFAADGSVDATFGTGGTTVLQTASREFTAHRLLALGSGGFVVGGQAIDTGAPAVAYTARFDAKGDPDAMYGFGGVYRYPSPGGSVLRALDVAGNGRLLLGIARLADSGAVTETLQRISATTGRLDPGFGTNGVVVVFHHAVDSVVDGSGRSLTVGTKVGSVSTVTVQRRFG